MARGREVDARAQGGEGDASTTPPGRDRGPTGAGPPPAASGVRSMPELRRASPASNVSLRRSSPPPTDRRRAPTPPPPPARGRARAATLQDRSRPGARGRGRRDRRGPRGRSPVRFRRGRRGSARGWVGGRTWVRRRCAEAAWYSQLGRTSTRTSTPSWVAPGSSIPSATPRRAAPSGAPPESLPGLASLGRGTPARSGGHGVAQRHRPHAGEPFRIPRIESTPVSLPGA